MKHYYIYIIRNIKNGKFYLGSTVNPRKRVSEHWRLLSCGKHHCIRLQGAYKRYGVGIFEFVVIDHGLLLSWDCKYDREQYYLDLLKPEYNCSKDARNGLSYFKWDSKEGKEARRKQSLSLKGRIPSNLSLIQKMRAKPIEEIENEAVVRQYDSCKQAGEVLSIDYRLIHNVVKGKVKRIRKYPSKTWRYKCR